MITFKEVHKWFKDLHVLNDINLHVKQGEVVVVCGPSGSREIDADTDHQQARADQQRDADR